jgi:voltage-gated potassium channel
MLLSTKQAIVDIMKFLISQLYYLLSHRQSRINTLNLLRFLSLLFGLIATYSVLFHYIMLLEGRTEYSWLTGFYWTLTVMSTLGFGDITFSSDLGRLFTTVVLLSGIVFLLILLPFTFIEFFYAPWLKAQKEARAPRRLPENTRGHVVLTAYDAVTHALIERLKAHHIPYVLIVPTLEEALRLYDLGYRVMLGDLDSPKTYINAQVGNALLVATTQNDRINTNVAFTVREISEDVPIVATANTAPSVDILQLAGCNYVLQLGELMGQGLARRVMDGPNIAHVIGSFGDLQIAEATVERTNLVGKQLRDSHLREKVGVNVLGLWKRGTFQPAYPEMTLERGNVLVIAGTAEDIERYNALVSEPLGTEYPVIIIGGGRVGRATARALAERGLDYRIVEALPERIRNSDKYILGDAADIEVLEKAGIDNTDIVVITTHDDDTNVYLTLYCRRLRPDIQIISRARLDRNVATLHRAGADFVMSYASIGSTMLLNLLNRANILMVAEGLDLLKIKVPESLAGETIAEADLRNKTGCTIVAVKTPEKTFTNPAPDLVLPENAELVLIGTKEAEDKLLDQYANEIT